MLYHCRTGECRSRNEAMALSGKIEQMPGQAQHDGCAPIYCRTNNQCSEIEDVSACNIDLFDVAPVNVARCFFTGLLLAAVRYRWNAL